MPDPEPTKPSPTPVRDALRRLGLALRPLPADDEIYRSGPLIFFVSSPSGDHHEAQQQED